MENLNNYLNLAESLVIMVIAIWGFIRWRKQYIWTRMYELKIKVMTNMYSIERAIRKIRKVDKFPSKGVNDAGVFKEKYRTYQTEFDSIDCFKDEIKASLGALYIEPYNKLVVQIDLLRSAAVRISMQDIEEVELPILDSIIHAKSNPQDDRYALNINKIINEMESLFETKLKIGPFKRIGRLQAYIF